MKAYHCINSVTGWYTSCLTLWHSFDKNFFTNVNFERYRHSVPPYEIDKASGSEFLTLGYSSYLEKGLEQVFQTARSAKLHAEAALMANLLALGKVSPIFSMSRLSNFFAGCYRILGRVQKMLRSMLDLGYSTERTEPSQCQTFQWQSRDRVWLDTS
jgi:hypothetical protein